MEALGSSEMSVLTRATWHDMPEDGVLQIVISSSLKDSLYDVLCDELKPLLVNEQCFIIMWKPFSLQWQLAKMRDLL
jgi:hypothetical protein